MADYSEECIHRDRNGRINCTVFEMSCAMFHTRTKGRIPGFNKCPYFEDIEIAAKNAEARLRLEKFGGD